jgi:hypothetical protein
MEVMWSNPWRLDVDYAEDLRNIAKEYALPPCGTACCIAGLACFLYPDGLFHNKNIWKHAGEVLDLCPGEDDRLFSQFSDLTSDDDLSVCELPEALERIDSLIERYSQ